MNASGMSDGLASPALPPELKRWNWGAFGLNWIWGIAHRSYFALLVFVPLFGLVVPFILGAKGNAWAWQNGHWESVDEFRTAQRRWSFYALIAYAGFAVLCVVAFFAANAAIKRSEVFIAASSEVQTNERVVAALGTPIEVGQVTGNLSVAGGTGEANFSFPVSGPKSRGDVYVVARKELGHWMMSQLVLELASGQRVDLNEAAPSPAAAAPNAPQPAAAVAATRRSVRLAGKPDLHGSVPRKPLEQMLARHLTELSFCFATDSAPAREVALKVIVDPRGAVQTTQLLEPALEGTPVERCVGSAVARWQFPKPKDGIAIITQQLAVSVAGP